MVYFTKWNRRISLYCVKNKYIRGKKRFYD
jgi:hypothetical protein